MMVLRPRPQAQNGAQFPKPAQFLAATPSLAAYFPKRTALDPKRPLGTHHGFGRYCAEADCRYRVNAPVGQHETGYSMTSSARCRIDCGTVRPSALAVCRLMTSDHFVGRCTGSSAGLAPLRMRSM